jgi:hypothetical protein
LFDTEANQTTVLPEWENGYSQFVFIDDESFYAFVESANYESGVKFYKAENPSAPYASWNPADSGVANEKNKSLLYVYKIDSEKMILAFWCETPKELDGPLLNADVKAVVAESFARIFFRNAINLGLPLITCKGVSAKVQTGHELSVDMEAGVLTDKTTGEQLACEKLGGHVLNIINAGGIKPLFRAKYAENNSRG